MCLTFGRNRLEQGETRHEQRTVRLTSHDLRPPQASRLAARLAAIVAVLLGILVAVLGFFALLMWIDARNARDDAHKAATQAQSAASMPGMDTSATSGGGLKSYAGAAPANADAIAAAHKAFPATLPAAAGRRRSPT